MERINRRRNRRDKFNADLHGVKLEASEEIIKPKKLTEDQERAIDEAHKRMQKRHKEKYGRSNSKN